MYTYTHTCIAAHGKEPALPVKDSSGVTTYIEAMQQEPEQGMFVRARALECVYETFFWCKNTYTRHVAPCIQAWQQEPEKDMCVCMYVYIYIYIYI